MTSFTKNRRVVLLTLLYLIVLIVVIQTIMNGQSIQRLSVTKMLTASHDNVRDDWPPADIIDAILRKSSKKDSYTSFKANDDSKNKKLRVQQVPRLIVAASNSAYVDFADNFANSLLSVDVTNFVFVPLDTEAYNKLYAAYPEHTLPIMPNTTYDPQSNSSASFGTEEFKEVTSSRPKFISAFLQKGYGVFYNDIDVVWKRNVWNIVDKRIRVLTDSSNTTNNDIKIDTVFWKDFNSYICTCFVYTLPTQSSMHIMKLWDDAIQTKAFENDQYAFNVVAMQLDFHDGVAYNNTVLIHVNDEQFPSGAQFNWEQQSTPDDPASLIHNNWIVGKENKFTRFTKTGLWNPSGRLKQSN